MKFLLMLAGEPGIGPTPGSPEFTEMLARYQQVTEEMASSGVLIANGPLQGSAAATTIRVRGGQRIVNEGSPAEIRGELNGYYVLDCANVDSAIEWAAKIPAARYGSIEVRPIVNMPG